MCTGKEIRNKVNGLYNTIHQAKADLEDIREKCKHEKTHSGMYSWAPGHCFPATICDDCDMCIDRAQEELPAPATYTCASSFIIKPDTTTQD